VNGQSNGFSGGSGTASPNTNTMGRGYARIGYWGQFTILSQRTWRNLYRNPMLMLTHYAIAILLAVLSGFLFYGLTDDIPGFQNRLGLFFFLLSLFGFSTLTSLTVFASERLLFVRERANGYYSPITYFLAKVVFDIIPLRIIPPIIMGSIVYPMTGLVPDMAHFLPFLLILVLFNLAAAAICLFIGIVCKDHGVANLIGSLVMLFSLLFAGLLLNHDAIPAAALWLQSLSIFHYGFESLIVNEVAMLTLRDMKFGLSIEVPGATILSSFGFDNMALWSDVSKLGAFSAVFVVLAYVAMHVLLVEKR
jgi:ATP-binding cassette subfamily G (WHITE) protein 2